MALANPFVECCSVSKSSAGKEGAGTLWHGERVLSLPRLGYGGFCPALCIPMA